MRLVLAALLTIQAGFVHAQQVVLVTFDGRESAARLVAIGGESVEVLVSGTRRQFPLEEVMAIRRRGGQVSENPTTWQVALVDGSLLTATQVHATDTEVTLRRPNADEVVVPRREIDWLTQVRYEDPGLEARWQEILKPTERAADLLVFRRDNQLDYLEGLVGAIGDDAIEFRRNGQINQVPLNRVDAVVCFQPVQRTFGQPTGQLTTAAGDRIALKTATVADDQLQLVTVCGLEMSMPLDQLVTINLGNRRLVYLSKLEPALADWQPLILNREIVGHQKVLNRPRFDQSFDGQVLQLRFPRNDAGNVPARRVEYSHGIAVRGGSRLAFELAGQFSELSGIAGFAPEHSRDGNVELVISGDGRQLLRQVLNQQRDGPLPVQVNVAGVRRLVIRIDYSDGRDIGDLLHLCDFKLSR